MEHDANGVVKVKSKMSSVSSVAMSERYDSMYVDIEIVFVAGGDGR
jgi:hypothetical protein